MRWLYYQYRGKLPSRYRAWILHDAICDTWLVRVVIRGLVQVAPLAAALFAGFLLFGGSWLPALGSVILGVLVTIRYTLSYSVESVDARVARNGFPAGHASALRRQAYEAAHAEAAERYRAVWRTTGE